jgi:hypothetical protein
VQLQHVEHVIELRTDTERRRIPITLTAGGQVSQYFEFARAGATATGELLVRTEPLGAAVTVDGNYVGRSPVSVPDLAPGPLGGGVQGGSGTQSGRVCCEGGRGAALAVQVSAGQTLTLKPTWPRGAMAINAIPWAEVFVDNTRVGETPIGNFAVPIGAHEVIFRHPELGERRMSVTVSVGEPVKVGVDLRSK